MTAHVETTDLDPLMQGEAPAPDLPVTPQARVDASRAALQLWVLRTYHPERLQPAAEPGEAPPETHDDDPAWLAMMMDTMNELPVVAVAARYLQRWWRRHPLYATFHVADEAGRELLRPMAKRHPWLLLGGAVVIGVGLGRVRPWRWVSRQTLLAGLIPPISLASVLATVTAMFAPAPPPDDGASTPDPETGAMPADTTSEPVREAA